MNVDGLVELNKQILNGENMCEWTSHSLPLHIHQGSPRYDRHRGEGHPGRQHKPRISVSPVSQDLKREPWAKRDLKSRTQCPGDHLVTTL